MLSFSFLYPFFLFLLIVATISSLTLSGYSDNGHSSFVPSVKGRAFNISSWGCYRFLQNPFFTIYNRSFLYSYFVKKLSLNHWYNFKNLSTKSFEVIFHLKFFFFRYSHATLYQLTLWCHTYCVLFGGKSTTWSWHNTPSCIAGFRLLVIFVKFLHWFIWVRLTYASLSHRLLVFSVKIMLFS